MSDLRQQLQDLNGLLSEASAIYLLCDPTLDDPPCPECEALFEKFRALVRAASPPTPPQENTYGESFNDGLGDDPARVHAALEAVGRKMGTAQSAICPRCGKDVATMRVFKYHKNRRDEWCPSTGTNMDAALLATPPPQEPS